MLYGVVFLFVFRGCALNVDPGVEADLAQMLQAPGIYCKIPALKACVTFRRLHATEVKALRLSNNSEFIRTPAGDVVEGCEKTWTAQCTAGLCPEVSEYDQHQRATQCRRLLEMSWQGPDMWPKRTTPAMPPPPKPTPPPCKEVQPEVGKALETSISKKPRRRRRRRSRRRRLQKAKKLKTKKSGGSQEREDEAPSDSEDEHEDEYKHPDDYATIGNHTADETHHTISVSEGEPEQLRAAVHDLKKMVIEAYKKGMQVGSRLGGLANKHLEEPTTPAPASLTRSSVPVQQAAPVQLSTAQPQVIYVQPAMQPQAQIQQVQHEGGGDSAAASAAAAAASAAAAVAASIANNLQSTAAPSILDRHPLKLPPGDSNQQELQPGPPQRSQIPPTPDLPAPASVGSKEWDVPPVVPPEPLDTTSPSKRPPKPVEPIPPRSPRKPQPPRPPKKPEPPAAPMPPAPPTKSKAAFVPPPPSPVAEPEQPELVPPAPPTKPEAAVMPPPAPPVAEAPVPPKLPKAPTPPLVQSTTSTTSSTLFKVSNPKQDKYIPCCEDTKEKKAPKPKTPFVPPPIPKIDIPDLLTDSETKKPDKPQMFLGRQSEA